MATFIIVGGTAFGALLVRHSLGFGFSLFFVPITALVIGFQDAVVMAVFLEVVVSLLMAVEYRASLRLWDSLFLKVASFVGVWSGLLVAAQVPQELVVAVSMLLLVGLCVYLLRRRTLEMRHNKFALLCAGILSGALNTWSSMSGPPVVLYYLTTEHTVEDVRGALSGYFLLLYLFTATSFILDNKLAGFDYWVETAFGAVIITFSIGVSRRVAHRIGNRFKTYSLVTIVIAALAVILREAGVR